MHDTLIAAIAQANRYASVYAWYVYTLPSGKFIISDYPPDYWPTMQLKATIPAIV